MNDDDLKKLAAQYRDAIGRRDASTLPLAMSVRYTENGQMIPLTRGIWTMATEAPADYLSLSDAAMQHVVLFGVLASDERRFLYGTRLRVDAGLVTEIETLIVTKQSDMARRGVENILAAGAPRRVLTEVVSRERRLSRERLERIPHQYFDAVAADDGSLFPGAPGCVRWENGLQTAPRTEQARRVMVDEWGFPDLGELDVKADLSTGLYKHITATPGRRILAVDEERQIVIAAGIFEHDGNVFSLPELGIERTRPIMRTPFSNVFFELFKADDGEVVAIESVGIISSSGATHGWAIDPVVRAGLA